MRTGRGDSDSSLAYRERAFGGHQVEVGFLVPERTRGRGAGLGAKGGGPRYGGASVRVPSASCWMRPRENSNGWYCPVAHIGTKSL